MIRLTSWSVLWLSILALPAHANFCKSVTTERARDEARLLEKERFAVGADDYIGDRVYNSDIISCNRKRDSKGNEIEKAIAFNHEFGANLEARAVKGKYDYYSTAPLAYAYELRREGNHWIVRVPIRFHWPTARYTDMIDISKKLVDELADPTLSNLCKAGATVFEKNNKDVIRGYIPIRNSATTGTDTVARDEEACRVPRSTQVADESILHHLRRFYANSLIRVWDRPGFRIEPVLLDHGEGTEAEINAWDKDGITWELRLNLMPDHRASYKRWTFKWNNMYTGVPPHVIAHEFGHKLGLDDEYGWGPNATRSDRDCANRSNTARSEYIMCDQGASWDSPGTSLDDDVRDGAKGVYPWIVTRRYAVAQELTCKEDNDCGLGMFCAKGALTLERNECQALRPVGRFCDRDAQCGTERCVLGSCASEHECLTDTECGDGRFCKIGLGDIDRNTCRTELADWEPCTDDKQCKSSECSGWRPQDGQTSGICYTANSKQSGDSCKIDLECSAGACNSNKRCVCKSDDDCSGGSQWCDKGADLHENSCRAKLDKGQACGKYLDVGVSRRCKSGKCSTKTGLGVPGATTIYCQ